MSSINTQDTYVLETDLKDVKYMFNDSLTHTSFFKAIMNDGSEQLLSAEINIYGSREYKIAGKKLVYDIQKKISSTQSTYNLEKDLKDVQYICYDKESHTSFFRAEMNDGYKQLLAATINSDKSISYIMPGKILTDSSQSSSKGTSITK